MIVPTLKINLTSINKNLHRIQNLTNQNVETSAVVKANAYGLGIDPIAKQLFKNGVKTFFVSTLNEAIELRNLLKLTAKIYYLNGYSISHHKPINEYNISPVLNSVEQVENFRNQENQVPAALQVDVGMRRLGLHPCEILTLKENSRPINLNLILGHLSSADDKLDPNNLNQLKLFSKVSAFFPKVRKSLAATGGIVLGKKYHFDLTRPGIGIFGGKPLNRAENVVSLDLPILQIKKLKKNEGVGYNHTFISNDNKKIAIVGSGYADGLSRQLSNKGVLYAGNKSCPILGRVSMDLITVDISALADPPTSLSVLGAAQTIDDLALQSSTIGYEILTSLGYRYKRVYHY